MFSLPEVQGEKSALLSTNISQDPLENFFGCQRLRGGTSDNPSVSEFYQNTQALRVVNFFCRGPVRGNCRGVKASQNITEEASLPLPRRQKNKLLKRRIMLCITKMYLLCASYIALCRDCCCVINHFLHTLK